MCHDHGCLRKQADRLERNIGLEAQVMLCQISYDYTSVRLSKTKENLLICNGFEAGLGLDGRVLRNV